MHASMITFVAISCQHKPGCERGEEKSALDVIFANIAKMGVTADVFPFASSTNNALAPTNPQHDSLCHEPHLKNDNIHHASAINRKDGSESRQVRTAMDWARDAAQDASSDMHGGSGTSSVFDVASTKRGTTARVTFTHIV